MHLKEQLKAEMLQAMKNQEKERLMSIRMINAAVKQQEVDSQTELNDHGVVSILVKMQKQHIDSIQQFSDAGRQDLVERESTQLSVVESFLPKPLTGEEINQIIEAAFDAIQPESMKDMGKIMSFVKTDLEGRADMKVVSEAIKQRLAVL